jgi:hypothetical protein
MAGGSGQEIVITIGFRCNTGGNITGWERLCETSNDSD